MNPIKPNCFPPTSRYFGIEVAQHQAQPEGPIFNYLRRRFLPSPSRFSTLAEYTVKQGDRLDNVTAGFLRDPEQFWRLCDPNNALHPQEIVDQVGRVLRITLPEGIEGPSLA